jgi:probable HAF family extracellular repeat protein
MTPIPPFADGTFSVAHGVNTLGQVVGWGDRAGGARVHAFVWDRASGLRDLGTLDTAGPGIATYAHGINEAGQVVGEAIRGDGSSRAFVWDPQSGMREMAPLPGGGFSAARAINGAGQVLGQSTNALREDRAVRWQLNRPPAAQPQALGTLQDTALAVTLGGTDPDGDSLVFEVVTGPGQGVLSGTPPAVTYTPAPGYAGPDAFSFRVGDGTVWSAPATVSLTVTAPAPEPEPGPPPPTPGEDPAGRMHGAGTVETDGQRHHFEFRLRGGGPRPLSGRLEYHVKSANPTAGHRGQRRPAGHFVTTQITEGAFADDPERAPGRRPPVAVDTATFGGRGRWNGAPGYAFQARVQDGGEPGPGRDRFELTISDASGAVVAGVSGTLSAGNIQSGRPRQP